MWCEYLEVCSSTASDEQCIAREDRGHVVQDIGHAADSVAYSTTSGTTGPVANDNIQYIK